MKKNKKRLKAQSRVLICLDGDLGKYIVRDFEKKGVKPKLFERPIEFLLELQTASYRHMEYRDGWQIPASGIPLAPVCRTRY